ncbi:MAG: rod shape-determining protein [Clostridia bacterium]|nr:rod shape-determining protein [Clostridia bacterium]
MAGLNIGIDIGAENTTVLVAGRGIVAREPSSLLIDSATDEIIPADKARINDLRGRLPDSMRIADIVENGAITDMELAGRLCKGYIDRAVYGRIVRPNVAFAAPEDITSVEREAVIKMLKRAGALGVCIVPSGFAAAVGADNCLPDADGTLTVDIGKGSTKAVTVSLNESVSAIAVRTGSGSINESIIKYLRRVRGVMIGENTAEIIKRRIGSAVETGIEAAWVTAGRSVSGGRAVLIELSSDEVYAAIEPDMQVISGCVKKALADAPADITGDILRRGAYLTGGGALLRGMAAFLSDETGVRFTVCKDPVTATARGLAEIISNPDRFRQLKFISAWTPEFGT